MDPQIESDFMCHWFINRAAIGVRSSSFTRGLFFSRAAVGMRGSSLTRVFFFFILSVS